MTLGSDRANSAVALKSKRRRKVLAVLLAGGLLILAAAGVWLRFSLYPSVGSGPAGPVVADQDFNRPWTERPVLLVGLGDSITAGFGARRGYGYFDRLVKNAPGDDARFERICLSTVLPQLRATNLAVSGSVSAEVVPSQLSRLGSISSNTLGWIVMTTGGNDLIHNYGRTAPRELAAYGAAWEEALPWIQNFSNRLVTIADGIEDVFPAGCHIFIANIYDPTDGAGDIERAGLPAWRDGARILAAYNNAIQGLAKSRTNVHLVDIHRAFLGHGLHCGQPWSEHYDRKDPHYWYYTNLEDPNERGYDALRRLFLIEMARVSKQLK
jgi:lysophospholipase L1-like esterase